MLVLLSKDIGTWRKTKFGAVVLVWESGKQRKPRIRSTPRKPCKLRKTRQPSPGNQGSQCAFPVLSPQQRHVLLGFPETMAFQVRKLKSGLPLPPLQGQDAFPVLSVKQRNLLLGFPVSIDFQVRHWKSGLPLAPPHGQDAFPVLSLKQRDLLLGFPVTIDFQLRN